MIIHNKDNKQISFTAAIPPGYDEPVIGGTNMFHCINDKYKLFVQEFCTSEYNLRYTRFSFAAPEHFTYSITGEGLHIIIALENNIRLYVDKAEVCIQPDESMCIGKMNEHFQIAFKQGINYRIFEVWFSSELVNQLNDIYMDSSNHLTRYFIISAMIKFLSHLQLRILSGR